MKLKLLLLLTLTTLGLSAYTTATLMPPVHTTTTTTTTTTTMALPTTTVCVENPAAQQWATQAHDDFLTGLAANQRLDQEDPTSAAYNNDYLQVQNAELAMSNDLTQLHAADNCGQYLSFQADS
jgi:hypothetical protein